jgi:hypothetical protein
MSASTFNPFGTVAPLIPGDIEQSDGVFNGDVKVFGVLDSAVSKSLVSTLEVSSSTLVPYTSTAALSAAQMISGVLVAGAATVTLPSATAFVTSLQTTTVGPASRVLGISPTVGQVFSLDIVPTVAGALVLGTDFTMLAPDEVSWTTITGPVTVKIVLTNVTTAPAGVVYAIGSN